MLIPGRRATVGPRAILRGSNRTICAALAASMVVVAIGSVKGQEPRADSQTQLHRRPASSEPLVIQGRITAIQGTLLTVKTPDGYPGGPGIHAQVVVGGPTFKVDVSRARVLLPDGRQTDTQPLAIGDRVLMVLSRTESESTAPLSPANVRQTYFASTIEHIECSGKIITH